MEENNVIFFAGGDAVLYLTKSMHKKSAATFAWGHSFSMYYLMTDFSTPSFCTHLYTFWMTSPPFPKLCTYLMDDIFLNQKTNMNIRISYSLKYKHSEKKFFAKK